MLAANSSALSSYWSSVWDLAAVFLNKSTQDRFLFGIARGKISPVINSLVCAWTKLQIHRTESLSFVRTISITLQLASRNSFRYFLDSFSNILLVVKEDGRWPPAIIKCGGVDVPRDGLNVVGWIWHLMYEIWCLVFDILCLIFNIWCSILDIWCLIFDIWYLIFDDWYLIFDVWYLMFDVWYLIFDIWC